MFEIRFHGRGGQGAVIASEILADALFKEKKYVQTFPEFGVERRGAPVQAFLRYDDKQIKIRYKVYNPDHIVILDKVLINQIPLFNGMKNDGWAIINSNFLPEHYSDKGCSIATCDATSIAIKYQLGPKTSPIVNTAMLGALIRVLPIVTPESIEKSIKEFFKSKSEQNISAMREAYNKTRMEKCLFNRELNKALGEYYETRA